MVSQVKFKVTLTDSHCLKLKIINTYNVLKSASKKILIYCSCCIVYNEVCRSRSLIGCCLIPADNSPLKSLSSFRLHDSSYCTLSTWRDTFPGLHSFNAFVNVKKSVQYVYWLSNFKDLSDPTICFNDPDSLSASLTV